LIQLIHEIAADVAGFGVAGEPVGEVVYFGEVFGADAVAECVREFLSVNGGANLALVAGGADEMKGDVQSFAFEGFPFAFLQPDAAGCRAARDMKWQAVAHSITKEQTAGFGADERLVFWFLGLRGRGFIRSWYGNFWLSFFPTEIGLERNPHAARRGTFVHRQSGFEFFGLHGRVRVQRAVHDLIDGTK